MNGRTLRMRPRLFLYYAEIEARILERRADWLGECVALANLPDIGVEVRDKLIESAVDKAADARFAIPSELEDYLSCFLGIVHTYWLQMKDCNDDAPTEQEIKEYLAEQFDAEYAEQLLTGAKPKEAHEKALARILPKWRRISDRATGEDDMGNSTGSSAGP